MRTMCDCDRCTCLRTNFRAALCGDWRRDFQSSITTTVIAAGSVTCRPTAAECTAGSIIDEIKIFESFWPQLVSSIENFMFASGTKLAQGRGGQRVEGESERG